MQLNIRFVFTNNAKYLRQEDVIKFILELSSGEEVDVRKRLEEAAESLKKII